MNKVKIVSQIVQSPEGPRMSYLVVAQIDGLEVRTRHMYHTDANRRVSHLCKHYACTEVFK